MSEINENNLLDNGAVDSDIKSKSNLLNASDTVQDIQDKALVTEVTSVAREEAATGQKIKVPSPEELYTNSGIANPDVRWKCIGWLSALSPLLYNHNSVDFKFTENEFRLSFK